MLSGAELAVTFQEDLEGLVHKGHGRAKFHIGNYLQMD